HRSVFIFLFLMWRPPRPPRPPPLAPRQCPGHDQAPACFVAVALHPDEPRENGLHHTPGARLAQGLGQERHGPRLVTVERLAEQLLLVAEGGVDAWPVNPHGPGELRERSPLVPARPEHVERPVQCLIHVELSRAPRGHGDPLVPFGKKMLSVLDRHLAGPYTFIVPTSTSNSREEIAMSRATQERPLEGKVALVTGGSR